MGYRLGAVALSTTDKRIYAGDTRKRVSIDQIWVANSTAGALTMRLHLCRDAEASSTTNALVYDYRVGVNGFVQLFSHGLGLELRDRDELRGKGSAAGLNIILIGTEGIL